MTIGSPVRMGTKAKAYEETHVATGTAPRVSVVMAAYNMGHYVAKAIESVLSQSEVNIELHVVDDGSTDDTRAIVHTFADDPRLHYHYQTNSGQTTAKNRGIAAARGEFVGFCDADDLWLPKKLELQLPHFLENADLGVVYSRIEEIDADGNSLGVQDYPGHSGRITQPLFFENFIPFGSTLVRRDLLTKFGAFRQELKMGIDWDLWLRLSVQCDFKFTTDTVYQYRVWPGQMSKNWRGRYDACFRIMDDFMRSNPEAISQETYRRAMSYSYVNRARARASISNDTLGCLYDCARAASYGTALLSAAKTAGRAILGGFRQ